MGKQKAHRRQEQKAKEALKNGGSGNSLGALPGMVNSGAITVKDPPAQPLVAAASATVEKKDEKKDTRAEFRHYETFFGLYAKSVRERRPFRSLGFIPGPAVVLEFREGNEVRIFAATSDVAERIGTVPTAWMQWNDISLEVRQPIDAWKAVVDGIGYEPSPYNIGLAKMLLDGRAPTKYLAMAMPRFRYLSGDPELPFGVVLLPVLEGGELKGLRVKTHNPKNIPGVPADDTVMTLAELKDGKGPIQKLLRTWALMETNYLGRYDRDGNRRQNVAYQPPARIIQSKQPAPVA